MSSPRHDLSRAKASAPAPIDLNPRRDTPLDFPDATLGELTADDYAELGFLCGLEVHQQLATERKLFCRCPSGRRSAGVDAEVLRHMRPTLSEMGEYDGTALMEFKTRKEIVYLLERSTVCTYEMDDTPPFPINLDAVKISLAVSRAFGLDLVSELHVMRKQYLDGSIPTGFQRTAMIGLGGSIPFRESELGPNREIRIRQLSLEEDSCREVSDVGHRITFRTDRLGVPLIETVSEPDLLTPRDAALAGRLMARVAHASGDVLRGPGAARQDVNVSIAGSRRVEIKGVSQHKLLPLLVHNEAYRQLNLLRIRAELARRGVSQQHFKLSQIELPWRISHLVADVGSLLANTMFSPVHSALSRGDVVCAVRLTGFGGLLRRPTQPGISFLQEFSERVRVIACPTSQPFTTSSDHDDGVSTAEWQQLRAATKAERGDAVVLLWAPRDDCATAVRELLTRAGEALDGVPSETRQPRPDGTTGFERILPGPQRMYPDTDTPPIPIADAWIREVEHAPHEQPWDRSDRYRGLGLSDAAATRLAAAAWANLFDALTPGNAETARRVAAALEKRIVHYWRSSGTHMLPLAGRLQPLVRALETGRMPGTACEPCLDRLLREPNRGAAEIVAEHCPSPEQEAALEDSIAAIVAARAGLDGIPDDAVLRWAMGTALRGRRRGSIDPKPLRARLLRELRLTESHR